MSTQPIDDGGPAFPMPSGFEPRVDTVTHYNEGMTLRDWFAGQALSGLTSQQVLPKTPESAAKICYEAADALLKTRKGPTQP